MPRTAPPADVARVYAAIPIAVITIIDAGTASSSPFQQTTKSVHDHAGIVFTFRWNPRSRCAGNREHHAPEYAIVIRRASVTSDAFSNSLATKSSTTASTSTCAAGMTGVYQHCGSHTYTAVWRRAEQRFEANRGCLTGCRISAVTTEQEKRTWTMHAIIEIKD